MTLPFDVRRLIRLASLLVISTITSACSLIGLGAAVPEASPTPLGDTLTFTIPAYTYSLEPGESVPGTRLNYIGRNGDSYEVSIDGLRATKRTGDSFIWNGVLAPGVYANFSLRLTLALFGPLAVAGPVRITVFYPDPVEQDIPVGLNPQLSYGNIVVNYLVPIGGPVPGSTLVYEGTVVQGEGEQTNTLARLSGLTGYPFLALGDSLVWTGKVRENVYVRYSLRVASLGEESIRVAGTADLWIAQDA